MKNFFLLVVVFSFYVISNVWKIAKTPKKPKLQLTNCLHFVIFGILSSPLLFSSLPSLSVSLSYFGDHILLLAVA